MQPPPINFYPFYLVVILTSHSNVNLYISEFKRTLKYQVVWRNWNDNCNIDHIFFVRVNFLTQSLQRFESHRKWVLKFMESIQNPLN